MSTCSPLDVGSGHNGENKRAVHGFEPSLDAALAAFAKSWRGD